jgi:hypothetical protein
MEEFNLKSKNWILAAVLVCLLGFPAFSQTPEQEVESVIRSLEVKGEHFEAIVRDKDMLAKWLKGEIL